MKKVIIILAIILMSVSGADAQKQPCKDPGCDDHDGDFNFNDDLAVTGGIDRPARYIVYGDGSTYTVYDGHTNKNLSSGTDAIEQLQYANDNLTANRTVQETVLILGDLTLGSSVSGVDSTLDMDSYSNWVCVNSNLTAANDIHADNLGAGENGLFENSDTTNGNKFISIDGCVFNGNDNFGGGEDTQTNAFNLIDFRVSNTDIDAGDGEGTTKTLGSTCTLRAGRSKRTAEVVDMVVEVDAASTFHYSINSGLDYNDTNDAMNCGGGSDPCLSVSIATSTTLATEASNSGGDLLLTGNTVASPQAHGLTDGETILFVTTDTLPDALYILTNYWVDEINANTFKVSESYEAHRQGVYVATDLTSDAGTHTFWQTQKIDRGIYVAFSATTCDASAPVDTWTMASNVNSNVEIINTELYSSPANGIWFQGVSYANLDNLNCSGMQGDCYTFQIEPNNNIILKNAVSENTDSSGFEVTGSAYNLRFENITARNARSNGAGTGGVGINFVVQTSSSNQEFIRDVTVLNAISYENYKHGINVINNISGGVKNQNINIRGGNVYENAKKDPGSQGVFLATTNGGSILNVTAHDNGVDSNERNIAVASSDNIDVGYNIVYNAGCGGILGDAVTKSRFHHNTVYDNGIVQDCWGMQITGNGTSVANSVTDNMLDKMVVRTSNFNQYGIKIDTGVVDTNASGNHVRAAESTLFFSDSGTSTSFGLNYLNNLPTQAEGTSGAIDCGGTVAHGLFGTPVWGVAQATNDADASVLSGISVALTDATNITINCTETAGDNSYTFYWKAVYKP